MIRRFLLLMPVVVLLFSCHREDETLIPSYIRIDSVQLVNNPSIQHISGSLSHQITDIWVYVTESSKQEFIGAFEMPSQVPILKEGEVTLTLRPGIKVNGIAETRGEYPFYEPYEANIRLVRDSVITLFPRVMYASSTEFVWMEDFEDGTSALNPTSRSDTTVIVTDDPLEVFEGDHSGKVRLDVLHFFFEAISNEALDLPKQGAEVYMEMDFMTDNEVLVGLFVNMYDQSVQSPIVVLNETGQWKKIYINLKNAVNYYNNSLDFNVFLNASKATALTDATILIDNLKVIHK